MLFLVLVAGALFCTPVVAEAATLTVTSNLDDGPGTLRQAIVAAASGDTINFAPRSVGLSTLGD